METDIDSQYAARRAACLVERDRRDRQSLAFSATRFVIVAAALVVVYGATSADWLQAPAAWALGGVLLVAFLVAIARHERVELAKALAAAQARLCDEYIARRSRRWYAMPAGAGLVAGESALAHDIDLEGRASLRHLIGRTATPGGAARITRWMDEAARGAIDPDAIAERQAAVRELAPLADLRLGLVADGMVGEPLKPHAPGAIDAWVATPRSPVTNPLVTLAAVALPVASVVAGLGLVAGEGALAFALSIPLVSWGLRFAFGASIGRAFSAADALSGEGRRYLSIIRAWEAYTPVSPRLVALRARLSPPHHAASTELATLKRLIDLADLRWSHLPHFFIHSATGWDLHVAAALERWKRRSGSHVAAWFDALDELDALATLAGLAHDEPTWCDPVIAPDADRVAAATLAHPLLSPTSRVANDVEIGPAGSSLVVTGSNMSGKSTLLRAVGLNIVLAQMGAPVCASALRLPRVSLATSIRITDSLAEGVSYFMSALLRLKAVVEAADAPGHGGPIVCYLLDEVLQGTNSEERQVAVRQVFAHLVASRAIGAMTTHDLHLVQTPEFIAHARHVHFTEHLHEGAEGPTITFDYRLRPGPATSRNALALMRMIGLADRVAPGGRPGHTAPAASGS